jgi:hypothetical protein
MLLLQGYQRSPPRGIIVEVCFHEEASRSLPEVDLSFFHRLVFDNSGRLYITLYQHGLNRQRSNLLILYLFSK